MLYTGVTGNISIGTKNLAHMSDWNVNKSKEMIEVVSFGDDYKEKIPSIKDWSASCNGKVDYDSNSGQIDIDDAFEAGTLLQFTFYLDEDTFHSGSGYIESVEFSTAADGAAEISINVSGSGKLKRVLPS